MFVEDVSTLQASSSTFFNVLSLVSTSVLASFPVSFFSLFTSFVSKDKKLLIPA